MTAAVAGIKTAQSHGLAAIAIAPSVWKENCGQLASHFSNPFATR